MKPELEVSTKVGGKRDSKAKKYGNQERSNLYKSLNKWSNY